MWRGNVAGIYYILYVLVEQKLQTWIQTHADEMHEEKQILINMRGIMWDFDLHCNKSLSVIIELGCIGFYLIKGFYMFSIHMGLWFEMSLLGTMTTV